MPAGGSSCQKFRKLASEIYHFDSKSEITYKMYVEICAINFHLLTPYTRLQIHFTHSTNMKEQNISAPLAATECDKAVTDATGRVCVDLRLNQFGASYVPRQRCKGLSKYCEFAMKNRCRRAPVCNQSWLSH